MPSDGSYTRHPFTVAACTACTSGVAASVVPKLQATVRNCPHAVLVVTQCILGPVACAAFNPGRGVMLMLQPCTADRIPVASVRWVGPVRTAAEADEVCAWIAAGSWDVEDLPPGLRAEVNLARSSRLN